jgi:hypothetical protein
MLRADVPALKIVAKATQVVPFSIGNIRGRRDCIGATICELLSSHYASYGDSLAGIPDTKLWSLAGPSAASAPKVALSTSHRCDRS